MNLEKAADYMEDTLGVVDPAWHTNPREDVWPFDEGDSFGYLKDCIHYVHIECTKGTFIYLPKHNRAVRLHVNEDNQAAADYLTDEGFYPWMKDFVEPMTDFCDVHGYTLWSY